MMKLFKYIFLTLITLLSYNTFSQTMPASGVATGASSGTWTVPANVYSIKIDAWGGGGAGAGQSTSGTGGLAGGAGGSRSTTTISVTPGQTIWFSIGAARAGTTGNAADGNDTWVSEVSNAAPTLSTDGVVAKGGKSAVGTTQGTGSNTGCVGTSNRGGSGRVGGASAGGGGSSAGTTLNGVDATGTAGATAPAGGGNGGGGHASGGNGTAGSAPGGGGGGAYKNNTTSRTGGGGAAGRVILTYQAIPNCATPTPVNGATNVSTSQTLSWAAVSGATSYDVYFGSTSSPTFIQNQAGTTYNPGTLNPISTYYWQVVPKNAAGSALGCSVWSFTTKAPGCLTASYGLYPSTTYTPACGGTVENITTTGYAGEYSNISLTSGVQYTFSSSNATDYITIGNSGGTTVLAYGTTPVVWTSTLTGTVRFYTHTNDACTEAMVSRTRRVQCAIVPSCTTPVDPLDGATSQSIGEVLTWNSVAAATSYDVYFGTSATPPFVVNQTGTTYTPATLSYNTTYYWKIVPKNGAGPATSCSTWSFSTGGPGCLNAPYGQFPSTTYNPNCSGSAENITTTGYAGEYSVVNLISNVQYTLSSSVSTDFITVTDATGSTILAYGTGSLNYTPSVDGDIRFYLHTNESCGTAATGRSRRIQCSTPPPPSNDLVANAIDVGLCGGTFTGNTKFATQTGDAPSCYTGSLETWTAPGVWYKVVGNGQNITASLCGSTFDTKIFIYTGTAGSLTCLTYNDDFCSTQSEVTFASTLNTTYHILVTGYGSAKGGFSLSVSLAASPPVISTQPTSGSVCAGQSRTFSVVASGNQGPLSYQWYLGGVAISGATSSSYVASTAGTYYVIVSNSCGATIQSSNATLTVNALPTITVSSPEICNGFSTQIVAGGGTSYVWSTGATTSTISVSPSSTTNYTVTGTDANGCQSQATSTVTVNSNPQVLLNSTSSTICAGGSGTNNIIATASSGTPTYTYQWQYWNGTSWLNTGTNTNTLNSTPTVTREYRVIVSDVKGCQVTSSSHTVTVVPDPINPTLNTKTPNQTDVCVGTNLSATFNPGTDGVSCGDVYQFSTNGTTWSTYTPGNTISTSSLTQGTTVQIRGRRTNCAASIGCSANGWDVLATWSIVTPPILSNSVTNVSCNGGTNGAINLTVSGSTPPYSYSWTGPNGFTASTEDLTGLSSGSYTVNVSVPSGCVSSSTITITQPSLLQSSLTKSDINCFGNSTGSINLTPTGGTTPYTFSWSNGATTEDISLLSAGNYSVTITDANGCQTTNSVTISQPAAALGSSSTQQNVLCNGGTGSIDLSVSGGTSPYTYSWSNGQTTQDISNVIAGTYSVTITDLKSCQTTRIITITQPSALSLSSTSTNVSCNGGSNGSIDLSVSGGTSPYTYLWSNSATTQDLTNIASGTYSVTVTDANGCQSTRTVTINQPTQLTSSLTKVNVLCFGNSTGSINLTSSGGTSPYTYSWSNGATTEDISLLSSGNYSVTITDANGCTTTNSTTITQPLSSLSSSYTSINVSCNGGNNGSIDLSVSGGTSPYTYSWSNSQTTQDLSNLTSGTYSVVVTDANSCQTTRTITISQPTQLTSTLTKVNVNCFGTSTGSIDITPTGGTLPYTYLWSNGSITEDLTNISSGSYTITITDANGCTTTNSTTITQPTQLSLSSTSTNVLCFGNSTGSIDLTVNGGTSPYTYSWSSGQTTQDLTNIPSSSYSVTVTDANGCQTTTSVTITEPTQLTSTFTQVNVSCNGGSNGSIDLSVSGGTSPYTYNWSNGQTTEDLAGLTSGNYSVSITDANGCQTTNSVTITQPSVLSSTHTQFNPSCFGTANGSINLTPTGGTSPYTYLWNNGQTTEDLNSLVAGTYSVTITDSKGCQATRTVTITQPTQLTSTVTTTNINCYGQNTGSASVSASGGTPPYLYMWNTGNTQSSISNLSAGNYQITVTDNKGCSKLTYVTITQPSELSISLNITSYPNCGSSNGSVSGSVIGGTPPYTYSWSNGSTSQNLTNVVSGNYTLTVTDSKGCQSQSSMTLGCTSAVINVGQIDGPTSICGINSASYTINYSNAGPQSITWSLPSGVTSTNGLSSPTINVNFSGSFVQDSIEVDVVSNGITYHRSLWISRMPNKPIISGNLCGDPIGSIKQYVVTNSQSNTTYNWISPYGVNVYTGQSNDTVQFKFSNVFINGSTASVTATNACGSSSTQFKLYKYVTRPTSILGPSTVCADGNTIYTYRVDSVPTSYMYIWAVPNGVSIIGSNYDDTLKVKFSTNFSSGQFSVMSVNQCGSSPMTYGTVSNNNLYANIGSITGPGDLCPYLGQSTTYSVSPQSGTFTWSVPTGMTIQSGQGTNVITVNVLNSFTSGSISVNLNNGCGGSISSNKTLSTTQSTISASSISGPRSVCSLIGTNTPATFSVSPINGVNYSWSVPENSTIVSGQGTNSVNVTFQNGFTGGNIQVIITGGCGNPITRTRLVDLGLPSVYISGVNCVDNGYTNTYSVSTTGALSFNWTVPGNAQIVRGQGTNSIDVFFPGNFESTSCINNNCDSIRLTTQFGCGSVLSKKKIGLLTVRPTVTGTSSVCFPDTIRLVASTSPRITSYIWNNSNGTQFIGSTTGNTVSAKTTSSFIGGTFSVMGANSCGSSPMAYFGITKVCPVPSSITTNDQTTESVYRIESESDFIEESKNIIDFITFPNPGKDKVNLRVFKGNSEYYFVQVYNLVGQKVYSGLHESEDILDLSKLEEGVFFITIEGKEGWKLTKELVISR